MHKLDLYRWAVQHPLAEAAFLERCYAHHVGGEPTRLREDFAGTSVVSGAWVLQDEDRRALAVEKHGPTARWAHRHARRTLGERAQDLVIVEADVMDLRSPRVDVVAALNFSALIYHDRPALVRYLRHARQCLDRRGVVVLDVFGGPGAERVGEQQRDVEPDESGIAPFTYTWEQRAFDAVRRRIDCRIHFGVAGKNRRDAFRYDWRLWTLPELLDAFAAAGYDGAAVWCDRADRPGRYEPVATLPAREDWVAYVVGWRA
jgi:SAM-dependent methyltransferase